MNSTINKPIIDFITDFNLLVDDTLIHFSGRVLFLVAGVPTQYNCEVVIVTIKQKQLDAIYLLNSEIAEDGFEDMFVIRKERIRYQEKSYLVIERDKKLQVYIFPGTSRSSPEKIIEQTL